MKRHTDKSGLLASLLVILQTNIFLLPGALHGFQKNHRCTFCTCADNWN